MAQCQDIAERALAQASATEVRALKLAAAPAGAGKLGAVS